MVRRTLSDRREFCDFAAAFARRLRPGDVVALAGPIGCGKTTFVRAVVEALHGVVRTSSPTFTFWHRYEGSPAIDHIDLYRIEDPNQRSELGLEGAFDDAGSIVLVEWWRNAPDLLPARRYEIEIEGAGDAPRTVSLIEPA